MYPNDEVSVPVEMRRLEFKIHQEKTHFWLVQIEMKDERKKTIGEIAGRDLAMRQLELRLEPGEIVIWADVQVYNAWPTFIQF